MPEHENLQARIVLAEAECAQVYHTGHLKQGDLRISCRQCHNLAYESQNETAHSRALSKVQAIRVKLGGEPAGDFPPKPKGICKFC